MAKVSVARENRVVTAVRRRAEEEVRVRALDASLAALVEHRRRVFVVRGFELEIGKRAQMFTQHLELLLVFDPRQ